MKFAKIGEKDVTRAILESFSKELYESVESDVVVVGAGPAGIMAGRDLAKNGIKALIIERNNYLGGGFWIGGYFMNKVTVRAPAQEVLDEIGVPYEEYRKGLYVADGPHAVSKLIASACDAGVKFLQLSLVEDVVMREGRVAGVVVNWAPVRALPREITCVDPVAFESKVVIDATGHEACIARKLAERELITVKNLGGMWVEMSEDAVVEHTGEIYPGLIVAGMSVAETIGLPRMGPTFGAMLLSGRRAAQVIQEKRLAAAA